MSFLGLGISITLGELSSLNEVPTVPSELRGIRYAGFVVLLDVVCAVVDGTGFVDIEVVGFRGASGLLNVAFGVGTTGLLVEWVKAFLSGLALPNSGSSRASRSACIVDF